MDVFHPVEIRLREALGNEPDRAVLDDADRLFCQRLHSDEPLRGNERLDVVVAAVAGADVVRIRLGLYKIPFRFQIGNDCLAALIAVHPLILTAVFVDGSVVVENADDLQIVPQTDLKVVRVVRRSHFDSARTKTDFAVLVAHNRNLAVHDRKNTGLADQVLELFILGVDRDAGIAHHGLGSGRRNDDVAGAVGQRITDIPQMTGLVGVLDLRVRQRSQAVRAPVDDAAALVDEPLLIHLAERLAHRLRAALVHREAASRPVAADAELLLLLDNAAAVFFLPRPDAL